MLQNIVHNSNQLIKSQYNDKDSLLCQLVKLKGKTRNLSFYESAQKKGSIFEEPQFIHKMTFDVFKKGHRNFATSTPSRNRIKSQQAPKNKNKQKLAKFTKHQKPQDLTLQGKQSIQYGRQGKIIHSRQNIEDSSSKTMRKIHHERVFSRKEKFIKTNQIIQEPGFVNLCFYKNTLEQIQNVRTGRFSTRTSKSPKRAQRQFSTRNKIKFLKYKGSLTDQKPQCRPWSPKNDSDLNDTDFPFFKSVIVKV